MTTDLIHDPAEQQSSWAHVFVAVYGKSWWLLLLAWNGFCEYLYLCDTMEEITDVSVAELLFRDDLSDICEDVPLRPVGPVVSNDTVMACEFFLLVFE